MPAEFCADCKALAGDPTRSTESSDHDCASESDAQRNERLDERLEMRHELLRDAC